MCKHISTCHPWSVNYFVHHFDLSFSLKQGNFESGHADSGLDNFYKIREKHSMEIIANEFIKY